MTLRPLDLQHGEALQALYDGAGDYFQLAWQRLPAPGLAERDLSEAAVDDGRYLLGIYLEADLVGVLDFRLAEPGPLDARLGLVLLDSAHRRQGLGSWALRIWEEWLRRATPTQAVVVTVLAQDYPAQAFFRSNGFTFSGQATRVPVGRSISRLLFMSKGL